MKKIIVLFALFFLPFSASAETLMGFMDGQLYDETGKLRYICFLDGSCIDKDNNQTTRKLLGLSPLPEIQLPYVSQPPTPTQTVYVPVYLPASIAPSQPTGGGQVAQEPVNNPSTTTPMSEFTPFNGLPYVVGFFDQWNPERTINNRYAAIAINLTTEDKNLNGSNQNYRLKCVTPLYPNGVFIDTARRAKFENGQPDGNKAIGTTAHHGYGNYSCKFVFTLPQGTFESETVEFILTKPE